MKFFKALITAGALLGSVAVANSQTALNHYQAGPRLIDGTQLNLMVDTVNNILGNGTAQVGKLSFLGTGNKTGNTRYFRWNVTSDLLDLRGQSKFILRPTAELFGTQIKTEWNLTTGEHNAIESTADWIANGTTGGGIRAISGLARVNATFTLSNNANLIGVRGIVQNAGTINGTGLHTGTYSLIESGGIWTSVGHLSAIWLDSHLAAAPGSGNFSLAVLTNNGAAQFNEAFYIYGGNKITNLFTFDTAGGMVSASEVPSTEAGWIKVKVGAATKYIRLYDNPTGGP